MQASVPKNMKITHKTENFKGEGLYYLIVLLLLYYYDFNLFYF